VCHRQIKPLRTLVYMTVQAAATVDKFDDTCTGALKMREWKTPG